LDALDPFREVTGISGVKTWPKIIKNREEPRFPAEFTWKWIHWSIHSQVRLPSAHAPTTAGLWSVWRAAARPATLWVGKPWMVDDGGWWANVQQKESLISIGLWS
jgi:hypothetical protein